MTDEKHRFSQFLRQNCFRNRTNGTSLDCLHPLFFNAAKRESAGKKRASTIKEKYKEENRGLWTVSNWVMLKTRIVQYMFSLTRPQLGAPSRPVWTTVGLDPIPSCMATYNYSCSSDNNISSRTRVAMMKALFKEIILMWQKEAIKKCTVIRSLIYSGLLEYATCTKGSALKTIQVQVKQQRMKIELLRWCRLNGHAILFSAYGLQFGGALRHETSKVAQGTMSLGECWEV